MDRLMVYSGQIPLETDLLNTNKFSMVGLGKLAAAILGTGTFFNGLACTQQTTPDLTVKVGVGEVYSLQNIDGTAYSSLAADTTNQIVKQGLLMAAVNLPCPAPVTAGQSINYLVQATYQDQDTNPVVLPYYNSSNPSQAYSGANNSGVAQNTTRSGVCVVSVKAGTAATTGSQTTPGADVGYTGLYVVTVANGQTAITNSNITTVSNAPFIVNKLTSLAPLNSPALIGTPTAPTPANVDNSTKIATTAFVQAITSTYLTAATAASIYAPLASPSLTGNPIAPTPALFDNDTSIATTEFVKANGHSVAGVVAISATSATLDTNHANKLVVYAGASNGVFTLPARSTYPAGTVIKFFNLTSTNALTLVRAGTDTINASGTSIVVSYGETLTLIASSSAGIWLTADGSAMLRAVTNNGFLNSLTSNGYQLLPNGLIIQWGTTGSVVANSVVNQSFPIAFPSNCFCVTASPIGSFSNANAAGLGIAKSTSAISIYNWGASINYSGGVMWIALGN